MLTTPGHRPLRIGIGAHLAALTTVAALALGTGLPAPAAYAVSSGVTAVVAGGELRITGAERNDSILVRSRSDNEAVIEVLTGLSRAPEFSFRRPIVDRITIATAAGTDRVTIDDRFGAVAATIPVTIDTGDGEDTVTGGAGAEVVLAGAGADVVDGGGGDDRLLLGSGDDHAVWRTGHGTDVVEGQTGQDDVVADGTASTDHLELAADGPRLRLYRPGHDGGLDGAGLEQWTVRPGAGPDTVIVNDLTGSGSREIDLDLDAAGGGTSDGWPDQVEVAGSPAADEIAAVRDGSGVQVSGIANPVGIVGSDWFVDRLVVDADLGEDRLRGDPAVGELLRMRLDGGNGKDTVTTDGTAAADQLSVSAVDGRVGFNASGDSYEATAEHTVVNGLAGNDSVQVLADLDPVTELTVDGGPGKDLIHGGNATEYLFGGDDNDQVIGHGGDDVIHLGDGNDHTYWSPGDGKDVVEGGAGNDGQQVIGDDGADQIQVSAAGQRIRVARNADLLDLNDVERLSTYLLRGADQVRVHDISGTDLYEVVADLGATVGGSGDGEADQVTLDGTMGVDHFALVGDSDFLSAQGLTWSPRVRHTDGLLDLLVINTLAGADTVDTSAMVLGTIQVSQP